MHRKSFNIAKNSKCDGYQLGLASVVYKCFKMLLIVALRWVNSLKDKKGITITNAF